MTPTATPPHLDGGPIRVVRNHDIYRGSDRCPTCGGSTDLFMTGLDSYGAADVWTWRRPHPGCVVAALGRGARSVPGVESERPAAVPLGSVRVAVAVVGLGPDLLRWTLARHRAGDFGRLAGPEPTDLDPWCPGVFGVAGRNRLAMGSGVGLVASRFALGPDELDVAILTALGVGRPATLAVAPDEVPAEVLQDELPGCDRRFYAGGSLDPGDGANLTRKRSGRQIRPGGIERVAASVR